MSGKKIAGFLLKQKSPDWSFNYWQRGTNIAKKHPYPDDLDDTFCAAAALYSHDPGLISGASLAQLTKLLLQTEARVGGPYKTWLVPASFPKVWQDTDLAINNNIALFLALQNLSLPSIRQMTEAAIKKNNYHSPYYPSPLPVVYFIARAQQNYLTGESKKRLRDYLWSQKWKNPLDTALAATSLMRLGEPINMIRPVVNKLVRQGPKLTEAYAFCFDPAKDGRPSFAGSRAFTAAVILETLDCYEQAVTVGPNINSPSAKESKLYKNIITQAYIPLRGLAEPLRGETMGQIDKMLSRDRDHQITLMPYWCGKILEPHKIPNKDLVQLCLASLYGWVAYTMFDDILDGDAESRTLPAANHFYDLLAKSALTPKDPFGSIPELFHSIIGRTNQANSWEIKHCQIPIVRGVVHLPKNLPDYGDYKILADKSSGHSFGALAAVLLAGRDKKSRQFRGMEKFFRHYIIAKQLTDDAHDWEADLQRGRLNAASLLLLKKWRQTNHKTATLNPLKSLKKLRYMFWSEVILELTALINGHCLKARQALEQNFSSGRSAATTKLLSFIDPLQNAAAKAAHESRATLEFFKKIRKSPSEIRKFALFGSFIDRSAIIPS